ncbi:MAG: hypothetical protein A2669_00025 [Candidatus Yanofskybacteria bacterium RIFCSPHIGHO2_01_FULL_48_25b]|uniref:Solute-binding protein family 5 domain-containing protein n=1 Tax=Candidatus Yanofskybacteria bacterium RIFCSPHIGHO2_01_FULL_48_25b TaxID=1802672 RepID=A0A1F8F0P6_9BACT|nr:MAG: hypothetical protein A2669_00025 [Candidatus Yanofskybacteria bacterium RIFCSPHIGHO2_01_FULL_48_25b]
MQNDQHPIDDFFGLKQDSAENPISDKEQLRSILRRRSNWSDQIQLLPKVLSKKERYLVLSFLILIVGSIIAIPFSTYNHFTNPAPDYGGSFSEGIVGQPRHINPLLAQTNDPDRDLSNLIYSGLLKHNDAGKLVPDLAKSYDVSSDGLNYSFYLKDNIFWHDGEKLTADDVVYTIQTAQNADYSSPQKVNWQGVTVQKVDDYTIIFKLSNRYAQFLNNLTLGIMPHHIWSNIQAINFGVSEYNLRPVGSGPYMFQKLQKNDAGMIQSYQLASNKNYHDGRPYINNITFKFYASEDAMIEAYNNNEIRNLSVVSAQNLKKIKFKQRLDIKELKIPRYYGVFFNQSQNQNLADKNIRLALNYATNKKAIIDSVVGGKGTAVYSPLIENVIGIGQDIPKYEFNLEQAKAVLAASGWASPDEKGILKKGSSRLTLKITTAAIPDLSQIASILKDQWAKAGIEVTIEALNTPQLQQTIRDRNYQALLFGEILDLDPDPFSLWDSSQRQKLGLNLAMYENKTADNLLQEARQSLNPLDRINKYDSFQKIVINDVPAVFLYNPAYIYALTKDIKESNLAVVGMPSDRFENADKWYIETKRIIK